MTDILKLTVGQRVEAMRRAAEKEFRCTVRLNQEKRTQTEAQQFHICHMFLHNYFRHQRPKHRAADGKTIAWSHLSSAEIIWALIPKPEKQLLRTKSGQSPSKHSVNGKLAWIPGLEPDKDATVHNMSRYLHDKNVTSMAAPGQNGCGEPCGCGGKESRHVSGAACDVGGLAVLESLLKRKHAHKHGVDVLDEFLAQYLLCRPLAHMAGKAAEAWHLEALEKHAPHSGVHARHSAQHAHTTHRSAHHHIKHARVHGCVDNTGGC